MRTRLVGSAVTAAVLATGIVYVSSASQASRLSSSSEQIDNSSTAEQRLYVALGDSFSSGEGSPFVDPNELTQQFGVSSLDDLVPCPFLGSDSRTPVCGPSPQWAENDLGWLGDTGTDASALPTSERIAVEVGAAYNFGGNNCHRSAHAYPVRTWNKLAARDPSWTLDFRACSGALAEHFREDFRGEARQSAALQGETPNLVTIGFGGNDSGFGGFVTCGLAEGVIDRGFTLFGPPNINRLDSCRSLMAPSLPEKLDELRVRLNEVYAVIQGRTALPSGEYLNPAERVIAVGYPRVFPDEPPDSCGLGANASIGFDSMIWLNSVADQINEVIRQASIDYGIDYVDTTDIVNVPSADGVRHDFCIDDGSERWINRFVPSDLRRSMHPKFQYHEVVANRVIDCLDNPAGCDPSTLLDRWVSQVNEKCFRPEFEWTPNSTPQVKIRGLNLYLNWLDGVAAPPATAGGRDLLIALEASLRAGVQLQEQSIEGVAVGDLEEATVRLNESNELVRELTTQYPDAALALDQTRPVCD